MGLDFVNAISRPVLLDRLRSRRDTPLEGNLADWAIKCGPQVDQWHDSDKYDALGTLARIGGDGLNRVLNSWLERAGFGGKLHAMEMARRRVTPCTVELLIGQSETGGSFDESYGSVIKGHATAALATHRYWAPVIRYYLRNGLKCLSIVEECCPQVDAIVDDLALGEALIQFRGDGGPTPGSVLAVALVGGKKLLPDIRAALGRAESGSDLATACLIALRWLGDDDCGSVPIIAKLLATDADQATLTLQANGTPAAEQELVVELHRRPNLELAAFLASITLHHAVGIGAICKEAAKPAQLRSDSFFRSIIAYLGSAMLQELAYRSEVFAFAEEVGYNPHLSVFYGEAPAALRLIGIRHPDVAFRVALSHLRNPGIPNGELYAPLVADLAPSRAPAELLGVVLRFKSSTWIVRAIGRELGRLEATAIVCEWLADPAAEKRLAACRVAGFLPPTEEVDASILAGVDDADRRVSDAALAAHERIRRARTAEELVREIAVEDDLTHRWVLLDALVSVADPGDELPPAWIVAIQPFLTPAMASSLSEKLRKRRDELKRELDREDRHRR